MNVDASPQTAQSALVDGRQAQSKQSNSCRGGKRPGAGRKPNIAKRLLSGTKPATAAEALEGIDVRAVVHDLLKNGSRSVKLQTLTVLWDRIYGKPKQDVSVSGGLVHAHTRDPFLASLPKEGLEALARSYDEVLAKYSTPVLDVAQDGPHNQKESKLATLVGQVDSEPVRMEKVRDLQSRSAAGSCPGLESRPQSSE